MAETRDTAAAAEGLVAMARRLDGGDPLRDEPASVFRPLEAAEPTAGDDEAGQAKQARQLPGGGR